MPNKCDITITPTRYPELGIARITGSIWRFVARDDARASFGPNVNCVGSSYRTKGEALADLDRFASDYGATGAHKCEDLRYVPINGAWSTGRPCHVCGAETGQPCIDGHVHAVRDSLRPGVTRVAAPVEMEWSHMAGAMVPKLPPGTFRA